jgi:hypothetical protein
MHRRFDSLQTRSFQIQFVGVAARASEAPRRCDVSLQCRGLQNFGTESEAQLERREGYHVVVYRNLGRWGATNRCEVGKSRTLGSYASFRCPSNFFLAGRSLYNRAASRPDKRDYRMRNDENDSIIHHGVRFVAGLIPGRTRSEIPDFFTFFVRKSGRLDPFTDPLKIICVNQLSCHQMRMRQLFQQQFQALR